MLHARFEISARGQLKSRARRDTNHRPAIFALAHYWLDFDRGGTLVAWPLKHDRELLAVLRRHDDDHEIVEVGAPDVTNLKNARSGTLLVQIGERLQGS